MESVIGNSADDQLFFTLIQSAQNEDGGWGFHRGGQSRVEPTCWALHALASPQANQKFIERGLKYLGAAQLADGSWPATTEEKTGCWVTSLATRVFLEFGGKDYLHMAVAGLRWVCEDWPRDSSWWQRWMRKLARAKKFSEQNDALRGWGWTPGTSSWVEPTACALLALEACPAELLPGTAKKRRELGEALIYDRMCPGGGWNCGNPRVYGVAGEPLVLPTAWALLALRRNPLRSENLLSLDWLAREVGKIQAPGSLALAQICLQASGRAWPTDAPSFRELHARNESLQNVQVAAWICMALRPETRWQIAGENAKSAPGKLS